MPIQAAAAPTSSARDNLGETPALMAAAALLIDYVLTVAVSIAAGVAAITSAFPDWHVNRVELTLAFVFILMVGNLRGIRESGRIFAAPTYFFITTILALIVVGNLAGADRERFRRRRAADRRSLRRSR